jgi:predicted SprT family Zn-dependent metalloprotease
MTQAEFRELVRDCIRKAEELYEVDLGRVRIDFDLKGTNAGMAYCKSSPTVGMTYALRFNKKAIDQHPEDMVESTIPHEVAHLIQGARPDLNSQDHDYKWRSIAISLGDTERGSRYHNMIF